MAAAVVYGNFAIRKAPVCNNAQYYLSGNLAPSTECFDFFVDDIFSPAFSRVTSLLAAENVSKDAQRNSYPESGNEADNYSLIGWSLILILLLALSLILLFQIRKREAIAKKIKLMAEERKILFDQAPCGYHSTDGHGVMINANDTFAEWLGYQQDELIGKLKFSDIVSGHAEALGEKLASMSRSKSGQIDITLIKKSGEPEFPTLGSKQLPQICEQVLVIVIFLAAIFVAVLSYSVYVLAYRPAA